MRRFEHIMGLTVAAYFTGVFSMITAYMLSVMQIPLAIISLGATIGFGAFSYSDLKALKRRRR